MIKQKIIEKLFKLKKKMYEKLHTMNKAFDTPVSCKLIGHKEKPNSTGRLLNVYKWADESCEYLF